MYLQHQVLQLQAQVLQRVRELPLLRRPPGLEPRQRERGLVHGGDADRALELAPPALARLCIALRRELDLVLREKMVAPRTATVANAVVDAAVTTVNSAIRLGRPCARRRAAR